MSRIANITTRTCLYIFYGLLAYMPFHIFLSTIFGVGLGVLAPAKVFKDVILMVGFMAIMAVSIRKDWFVQWLKSPLAILIAVYGALTLLLAFFRTADTDAEILAVVYNTRFLLFFLYGSLLLKHFNKKELRTTAIKITLIAGFIVAAFGVFQYLVLPDDALVGLGFTHDNGVLPAFFIDEKPDLERVMSTLRDPNSLGAYLIIIGSLLAAVGLRVKQRIKPAYFIIFCLSLVLCLVFTFSRSGWLSAVLAAMAFVILAYGTDALAKVRTKAKPSHFAVVGGIVAIAIVGMVVSWNSYFVQNVIFHADQATVLEDPNQLRLRFFGESVKEVVDNPLGTGPGTVGVVSSKNDLDTDRLTENYYLQITGEVGVIGIALFLAILVLVVLGLMRTHHLEHKKSLIAAALLASLVGISFSGLLNHIWINESLAYVWWGLAGLYVANLATSKDRS